MNSGDWEAFEAGFNAAHPEQWLSAGYVDNGVQHGSLDRTGRRLKSAGALLRLDDGEINRFVTAAELKAAVLVVSLLCAPVTAGGCAYFVAGVGVVGAADAGYRFYEDPNVCNGMNAGAQVVSTFGPAAVLSITGKAAATAGVTGLNNTIINGGGVAVGATGGIGSHAGLCE